MKTRPVKRSMVPVSRSTVRLDRSTVNRRGRMRIPDDRAADFDLRQPSADWKGAIREPLRPTAGSAPAADPDHRRAGPRALPLHAGDRAARGHRARPRGGVREADARAASAGAPGARPVRAGRRDPRRRSGLAGTRGDASRGPPARHDRARLGGGGAGFGLGSWFLTTLAASFIGTAIAQSFFDNDPGYAGEQSADGGSEAADAGDAGDTGDAGSGDQGDFGGGDFGGGDFGGGDFGGGDFGGF